MDTAIDVKHHNLKQVLLASTDEDLEATLGMLENLLKERKNVSKHYHANNHPDEEYVKLINHIHNEMKKVLRMTL